MKTLHQILLCIVLATAPLLSSAQDYPQKTVNGQKFYEYTMDKSEGFFALYRKFGIRQEEVLKYNPEAKDGLKLGQKILIPVPEEKKEAPAAPGMGGMGGMDGML